MGFADQGGFRCISLANASQKVGVLSDQFKTWSPGWAGRRGVEVETPRAKICSWTLSRTFGRSCSFKEVIKMGQKKRLEGRIVIDPKIHFGKPCVAGTRIPVEDVLELIQEGISFEEIVKSIIPT